MDWACGVDLCVEEANANLSAIICFLSPFRLIYYSLLCPKRKKEEEDRRVSFRGARECVSRLADTLGRLSIEY